MLAQYQRRHSNQYRYRGKRTDNGPTVSIQYTSRCKRAEHHGAKDNEIIERLDTVSFACFMALKDERRGADKTEIPTDP